VEKKRSEALWVDQQHVVSAQDEFSKLCFGFSVIPLLRAIENQVHVNVERFQHAAKVNVVLENNEHFFSDGFAQQVKRPAIRVVLQKKNNSALF